MAEGTVHADAEGTVHTDSPAKFPTKPTEE